jgi:hypothetical protein
MCWLLGPIWHWESIGSHMDSISAAKSFCMSQLCSFNSFLLLLSEFKNKNLLKKVGFGGFLWTNFQTKKKIPDFYIMFHWVSHQCKIVLKTLNFHILFVTSVEYVFWYFNNQRFWVFEQNHNRRVASYWVFEKVQNQQTTGSRYLKKKQNQRIAIYFKITTQTQEEICPLETPLKPTF